MTILVPKTDAEHDGQDQCGAIEAAKQKGFPRSGTVSARPIVPTPVYDGDGVRPSDGMPLGDGCKGHWVFTASAKVDYPPEVVDRKANLPQPVGGVQRACMGSA